MISAAVKIAGYFAVVGVIFSAAFCVLNVLHLAMVVSRDKVIMKFKDTVITKFIVSIVTGKFINYRYSDVIFFYFYRICKTWIIISNSLSNEYIFSQQSMRLSSEYYFRCKPTTKRTVTMLQEESLSICRYLTFFFTYLPTYLSTYMLYYSIVILRNLPTCIYIEFIIYLCASSLWFHGWWNICLFSGRSHNY